MRDPTPLRSELFNIIAAAIVALLIWAYANDRTRETATVSGTVRIAASDPRANFIEPTGAVTVSMEVRGSRRAIERVEDALRTGVSLATGSGVIPSEPGEFPIDLKDAIAADAGIMATGIEIARTKPEEIRVQIGKLVTDQVPVTAVLPRASVQGEIVIDPPVVAVTLPEAARIAVGAISLDALVDTKNLEPGRLHAVDVDLKLPDSLNRWKELVRVVPPRAKVSFSLLATTGQFVISSIPVEVAVAPAALDHYEVTLLSGSTSVPNVVVTGPLASIDQLRNADFAAAAVVSLSPRVLAPGVRKVPISMWRLPEGVTVISANGVAIAAGSAPIELSVEIKARVHAKPAVPATTPPAAPPPAP